MNEEMGILRSYGIGFRVLPMRVVNLLLGFLLSLALFDVVVTNKTACANPVCKSCFKRIRCLAEVGGFHLLDHLVLNPFMTIPKWLKLLDCFENMEM